MIINASEIVLPKCEKCIIVQNDKYMVYRWTDTNILNSDTSTGKECSDYCSFREEVFPICNCGKYKYFYVAIVDKITNKIIFIHRQHSISCLNPNLFKKDDEYWYQGSLDYLTQLFVNLQTCDSYDNYADYHKLLRDKDYSGYERKHDKKYEEIEFIWCTVKYVLSGRYAIVNGCVWGGLYHTRIYDVSDIPNGWNKFHNEIIKNDLIFNFNDFYVCNSNYVSEDDSIGGQIALDMIDTSVVSDVVNVEFIGMLSKNDVEKGILGGIFVESDFFLNEDNIYCIKLQEVVITHDEKKFTSKYDENVLKLKNFTELIW